MKKRDTRILLVDDEPDILEIIGYNLSSEGYQISTAENGVEAIAKAKKHRPHLIVLDVMMPEMDGPMLASEIKKNNPQQKILFISGYTENHENLISIQEKEVYFLNKPFTLEELNLTVKKVIQS